MAGEPALDRSAADMAMRRSALRAGVAKPKRIRLFWILFVSLLILDQAVKAWARFGLAEGQSLPIPWPGVFEIRLAYNTGIAFGAMQGYGQLLTPIAIAIALGAGMFVYRKPNEPTAAHVAMSMMAAGAVGNLIDRVWLEKVTDMLHIRAINFPIFNVADMCITFAAATLMVVWARESVQHEPKLPATAVSMPIMQAEGLPEAEPGNEPTGVMTQPESSEGSNQLHTAQDAEEPICDVQESSHQEKQV